MDAPYTDAQLLGFSYDLGVTIICHQNADAMVPSQCTYNIQNCGCPGVPCEQSPLVFLLGTAQRSERDSAELVYKFI